MAESRVEVVEYTDPGCSWAWGTEPKLRLLRWRYGDRLAWRRVQGGLIGDMDAYYEGQFDALRAVNGYISYWAEVAEATGMPYPARLKWMYRSTEPAGRAVKAAELQSEEVAERVLRRLREQTFVFGEPPDDLQRIEAALRGVAGLDLERLREDLGSPEAEAAFRRDWAETRRPNEYVMTLTDDEKGSGRAKHTEGHWRYVFPTLVVRGPDGERTVAGWRPYEDYEQALDAVAPGLTAEPRPDPAPEEAFATWPTLAPRELEAICGPEAKPPDGVVEHDWGEGVFWLTAEEAEARGLPR